MRELRKLFYNPPKGGNEVGVPTASSMSPLPSPMGNQVHQVTGAHDGGKCLSDQRKERERARMTPEQRYADMDREYQEESIRRGSPSGPLQQTSLRESFEKGELAARHNVVQSGQVGQPEFRNYDRGRIPAQTADDPAQLGAFDFLSGQTSQSGEVGAGHNGPTPPQVRSIKPSLRPDTSMPYRTDGKPNYPMPVKPSGNSPTFKSDGDNDYDDVDDVGGISPAEGRR